jgi:hypothetical protein
MDLTDPMETTPMTTRAFALCLLAAGAWGCGAADDTRLAGGSPATTALAEALEEGPPPAVVDFAALVREAAAAARAAGSNACGAPLPSAAIATPKDVEKRVEALVTGVTGGSKLRQTFLPCGGPQAGRCADLFQNAVYHFDGLMGDALLEAARIVAGTPEVGAEPVGGAGAETEGSPAQEPDPAAELRVVTPLKNGVALPPVVITATLTAFLRPEPAVKRGTLVAAIFMDSPVRGLRPSRAPRAATWNLPKPVKVTSPPDFSSPSMVRSTASTADAASFLLRPLSAATLSTNSDFDIGDSSFWPY